MSKSKPVNPPKKRSLNNGFVGNGKHLVNYVHYMHVVEKNVKQSMF